MKKFFGLAVLFASAFVSISSTGYAVQILTNNSFETPVVGNGNNIGTVPTGWSVDNGDPGSFNLVGDPGNGALGSNQYLDLTNGGTFIFQSFTLASNSLVDFGGYFSPRDNVTGGGSAQLYDASNTVLLAASPFVSATGLNAPWVLSQSAPIVLGAGSYVFRSTFDDPANTDANFVNVNPVPEPTSLTLLGLGALGLLAARRRNSHSA